MQRIINFLYIWRFQSDNLQLEFHPQCGIRTCLTVLPFALFRSVVRLCLYKVTVLLFSHIKNRRSTLYINKQQSCLAAQMKIAFGRL